MLCERFCFGHLRDWWNNDGWLKTAEFDSGFSFVCCCSQNVMAFGSGSYISKTSYNFFFLSLWHSLADQKVHIPAFDIQSLLPEDLGRYYRYNGSLTTPPCYQSVIWTLFHERVQISKAQVTLRHWHLSKEDFTYLSSVFTFRIDTSRLSWSKCCRNWETHQLQQQCYRQDNTVKDYWVGQGQ